MTSVEGMGVGGSPVKPPEEASSKASRPKVKVSPSRTVIKYSLEPDLQTGICKCRIVRSDGKSVEVQAKLQPKKTKNSLELPGRTTREKSSYVDRRTVAKALRDGLSQLFVQHMPDALKAAPDLHEAFSILGTRQRASKNAPAANTKIFQRIAQKTISTSTVEVGGEFRVPQMDRYAARLTAQVAKPIEKPKTDTFKEELQHIERDVQTHKEGSYIELETDTSFQTKAEIILDDAGKLAALIEEHSKGNKKVEEQAKAFSQKFQEHWDKQDKRLEQRYKEAIEMLLGKKTDDDLKTLLKDEVLNIPGVQKKKEFIKNLKAQNLLSPECSAQVEELLRSTTPFPRQKALCDVLLGTPVKPGIISEKAQLQGIEQVAIQRKMAGFLGQLSALKDKLLQDRRLINLVTEKPKVSQAFDNAIQKLMATLQLGVKALQEEDGDLDINKLRAILAKEFDALELTAQEKEAISFALDELLRPIQEEYDTIRLLQDMEDQNNSKLDASTFEDCSSALDELKKLIAEMGDSPEKPKCLALHDELRLMLKTVQEAAKRELTPDQLVVQTLGGKYNLPAPGAKPLAVGGYGKVYEMSSKDGKKFALKVLKEPISPLEWESTTLTGERIGAAIYHENVLQLHEVVKGKNGVVAVVSPFIKGHNLGQLIQGDKEELQAKAKSLLTQVAKGLQALHKKKIVHIDFHPGNILVDESGRVFVMDFGTSKKMKDFGSVTLGEVGGDNSYIAPEIRFASRGDMADQISLSSDLYGLGQMIYQIFEGKPYTGEKGKEFEKIKDPSLQALVKQFCDQDPTKRGTINDFFSCDFFRTS